MLKLGKIALTVSLIGLSQFSMAQTYSGLNYPKPEIDQKTTKKPVGLEDLMASVVTSQAGSTKEEVSAMRRQAIVEIASALGASAGLNYRMQQLKADVDNRAFELDALFDFRKMTIDNGVLAPVLVEGQANYTQDSPDQVRIADKMYKIEAPAKFYSVYPTWRSYITFTFPTFEMPPGAYLPKNDTEKNIWDAAVKEGWDKGVLQAGRIFEASYARLERDYMGMIKYKLLIAQGLITPTVIARQNLGVTGGGKEMAINDQVFRITDHSALNPNQKDWKVEYPVSNKTNGKVN